MKIDLKFNTKHWEERAKLTEKQIAYAAANAINRAMLDIQKREQANARTKFHLRGGSGEQLVLRSVAKIFQFASVTKAVPYGEIGIDQPKPRMLLLGLELGGQKQAAVGANVAVPITGNPARPSMDAAVPGNLMFTALGLKPPLTAAERAQRRSIKGGTAAETRSMRRDFTKAAGAGRVWQGNERTYMIPGVGVFQRRGPGKTDTTLLYKFVPRPALKPILGFRTLAIGEGDPLLAQYLDEEITKSVIHNAGR